jgi:hypothetical protein
VIEIRTHCPLFTAYYRFDGTVRLLQLLNHWLPSTLSAFTRIEYLIISLYELLILLFRSMVDYIPRKDAELVESAIVP